MDKVTKDDDPPIGSARSCSAPSLPPSADELDADSPGNVRVTFIVLMGVAALLCAIPRQWASAAILLGLAVSVAGLHYVTQRLQSRPRS